MAYSDLPNEFEGTVNNVFDTEGCLPAEWLDKVRMYFVAQLRQLDCDIILVGLVVKVSSTTEGDFKHGIREVYDQGPEGMSSSIFRVRPRQQQLSASRRAEGRVLLLGASPKDALCLR